jgi:lipoprotein-anchoring transpeptidase ErfK/SrfK
VAPRRSVRRGTVAARLRASLLLAVGLFLVLLGQAAAYPIARLEGNQLACAAPHESCSAEISAKRPLTGERTTLPVLGAQEGWLKVLLPGRQLGEAPPPKVGWINSTGAALADTPWRIVIKRKARRLIVYRDKRAVRSYPVVVGRASTPTPVGSFFVEETLALDRNTAGAPFAFALSARSRVFSEFEGGPGQVAIHGIANIGGKPGTAVSHGCIRTTTKASKWLARYIGPGVAVDVH